MTKLGSVSLAARPRWVSPGRPGKAAPATSKAKVVKQRSGFGKVLSPSANPFPGTFHSAFRNPKSAILVRHGSKSKI
jgi:hypothetical protein